METLTVSSMYNLLFRYHASASTALSALALEREQIPRFRDAWFTWDDPKHTTPLIVIVTRTGGNNRAYYESFESCMANFAGGECTGPFNDELRALPNYVRDEDDTFDPTYAYFYFTVPPESLELAVKCLDEFGEPPNLGERMDKVKQMLQNATNPSSAYD